MRDLMLDLLVLAILFVDEYWIIMLLMVLGLCLING